MEKILKPFTNIFDILDVTYSIFNIIGAASFSRTRRSDGRNVYFVGEWDFLMSIVICLFSSVGFVMLFFYSPYVVQTSRQDLYLYRIGFLLVFTLGVATRLMGGRRAHLFLASLNLIDEVDNYFRNRRLPLHYDSARFLIFTYIILPAYSVPLFIKYYYDDTTREEDNLYEVIHMILCFGLSYASILAQAIQIIAIAFVINDRIHQLGKYLDKLKMLKNSKIIEQELVVVSKLHFKLCQSWKFGVKSYGLSHVCLMELSYVYCFNPLAVMGYILPELNNASFPAAIILFIYMIFWIGKYESLQRTAEEFKMHVTGLNFARNNEDNFRTLGKTLLLQIEHWNIDLQFNGFMMMTPESYLEGLKFVSTVMMFFIQVQDI